MALTKGELSRVYTVNSVNTDDIALKDFLFSLGCYPGEKISIISKLSSNWVVNIKDARYSIDEELAKAIIV